MKAKDAIKEIQEWKGERRDLIEKLFNLYKKEFNIRKFMRFRGSNPSECGLIGLAKEMASWIDCIRIKGKFEWIGESAGTVMYNFMNPKKEQSSQDKPVDAKKVLMAYSVLGSMMSRRIESNGQNSEDRQESASTERQDSSSKDTN